MKANLILCVLYLLPSVVLAQCPELIWSDEFEGNSLDTTKWNYQLGDGCDINLCGWGNNELQYYQRENAVVNDGTLKIIARQESVNNRNYTSARLTTKGKGDFANGRFEARIKLPTGKGLWPAFWMLSTNEPYGSWPQSGEIDIMELIGSEPQTCHGTIHFGQLPNNRSSTANYGLTEGTFHDEFHTFAIEWDRTVIRWFVDDYLYSTKISTVTGGSRWPFDHDFHMLLNVAVGGNWPGSPNANTVFPQTMEVDYVRVYNGFFPSISGAQVVENKAADINYSINNLTDAAEVQWTIPTGASMKPLGSNAITVSWGDAGGVVQAIISDGCGTDTLSMSVVVQPPFVSELILENFDKPGEIQFHSATGNFVDESTNPTPNDINPSALCGLYDRNENELFDVIFYDTDVLENASPYLAGAKVLYLDVYTDAPPNTLILIQFENVARSQPDNYPIGRNSRFQASTSLQNEWHRLKFEFLDQPDQNTSPTSIDRVVILFGSNTNLNSRFYFDNFESYAPQQSVNTKHSNQKTSQIKLFPNPSLDYLNLELSEPSQGIITLYSATGFLERKIETAAIKMKHLIDIRTLPAGIHMLHWHDEFGHEKIVKFLKP